MHSESENIHVDKLNGGDGIASFYCSVYLLIFGMKFV